jgi:hypothetical protein
MGYCSLVWAEIWGICVVWCVLGIFRLDQKKLKSVGEICVGFKYHDAPSQMHETHAINMAVLQYPRWYGY